MVLTIVASSIAYSKAGDQEFTSATLYRGECSTPKNWVRSLYFLMNVLNTIMLAASNYFAYHLARLLIMSILNKGGLTLEDLV